MHVNEANSCLARGYCVQYKPAQGEWCLSNPPPTHALPMQDLSHFQRPRPKARTASIQGLKVLQLNLDSFCDHVRLTSRDRFLIFPQEMVKIYAPANICRTQIFWQVVPVQQPVQYGRDAAHISWAAWVLRSLEDHMKERQHHLNESSSEVGSWRFCRAQIVRVWVPIF